VDPGHTGRDPSVTARPSPLRLRTEEPAVKSFTSVNDLVGAGLAALGRAEALREVEGRYSVAVTPDIADLIDASDPEDPIAKQFLPDERELLTKDYERADPIGDKAFSPVEGIVHRYPDRVLLKLLSSQAATPWRCRRVGLAPFRSGWPKSIT
jgi:L-lysine 2,3-aminomutase